MGKASRRKKLKKLGGSPGGSKPRGKSAAQTLYLEQRARVAQHVARSLATERSPMTLVRLGLETVRSCEADSEQIMTAQRPVLACRAGCTYCCYPPVSATVPEVANIVAFISTQLDPQQQLRIRASVDQAHARTAGMGSEERAATNLPCPYLNDSGGCAVYPVRPLACRGYNSADVNACRSAFESPAPPPKQTERAVPAFIPLVATAQGLKEGLASALEAEGLPHPMVDLTRASRLLLEDLDGPLQAWLDGGDPFAQAAPF